MATRSLASLRPLLLSRGLLNETRTIERKLSTSTFNRNKEITKRVNCYGKLFIDVPWNVEVRPTDPHEYPDMDTLVVKIASPQLDDVQIEKCINIDVDQQVCRITAKAADQISLSKDDKFTIETPVQYDVDARICGSSSISISGMVSDFIAAKTEKGNILGSKLQAKKMIFESTMGGSIDLRTSLQGDIEVKTVQSGSIKAEKCLGTTLEMTTENGSIDLGSNYCGRATFKTTNGDLNLNNLHMDSNIDISGSGSLNISCLDGSLQAKIKNGDTKIHVVRLTGKSQIISEGPIDLIIPKENDIHLNLRSNKLSLDETLKETQKISREQVLKTNEEIFLDVETQSDLRIKGSSWVESLLLSNFKER